MQVQWRVCALTLAAVGLACAAGPPAWSAPSQAAVDAGTAEPAVDFRAWLARFADEARAAGISQATLDATLAKARWLPQVIEQDRAQPEFVRPIWTYLDGAVSAQRIATGKAQRLQHAQAFDAARQRYGVPASIVTAIWGIESSFGTHFGSFRAVDALATLAFDGRRRDWARGELLAALAIVERGELSADKLVGSWAGAMGHTQFLPSTYLKYAVDGDGDGKSDIWGSVPDVIASTANFLAQSGWRPSEPWGAEVRLPADFDYARAELTVRQDSSAWAADGVRAIDDKPLPVMRDASILTPAGARGPALLVGNNFRVLLRYNSSNNYAIAVALLARQIDGGPGLETAWPRQLKALTRTEIEALQLALNQRGMDAGEPDGVMGPATRAGLRRFQQSLELPADGFPTQALLQHLLQQP